MPHPEQEANNLASEDMQVISCNTREMRAYIANNELKMMKVQLDVYNISSIYVKQEIFYTSMSQVEFARHLSSNYF